MLQIRDVCLFSYFTNTFISCRCFFFLNALFIARAQHTCFFSHKKISDDVGDKLFKSSNDLENSQQKKYHNSVLPGWQKFSSSALASVDGMHSSKYTGLSGVDCGVAASIKSKGREREREKQSETTMKTKHRQLDHPFSDAATRNCMLTSSFYKSAGKAMCLPTPLFVLVLLFLRLCGVASSVPDAPKSLELRVASESSLSTIIVPLDNDGGSDITE